MTDHLENMNATPAKFSLPYKSTEHNGSTVYSSHHIANLSIFFLLEFFSKCRRVWRMPIGRLGLWQGPLIQSCTVRKLAIIMRGLTSG